MKTVALVARLLLGLMFVVFGLNGFLSFLHQPPMPDGPARQFTGVLGATHYMSVVFAIQLVCGVLFLLNRYIPLALTLIAPVLVNILLFHLLMEPHGIAPGAVACVLWLLVFSRCRSAFNGILQPRGAEPLNSASVGATS